MLKFISNTRKSEGKEIDVLLHRDSRKLVMHA